MMDLESQGSSLLSLTPELLVLIFNQCSMDDLLVIAQTCHQLNAVAVHVYLSRFRIHGGLDTTKIDLDSEGKNMRILHGLQSSVTLPKLDNLSVKFTIRECFADDLRHLLTFISRSGCIREVRLHLGDVGGWRDGHFAVVGPCRTSLIDLFSMLVENKCEVLDVRRARFIAHGDDPTANRRTIIGRKCRAFFRAPISTILGMLGVPPTLFARKLFRRPRLVEHHRSLRTFRLHSDLFFARPFYSWMMKMLKKTPITSLSLQASNVGEEEWRSFLGSLFISTLTNIAFVSPYIPISDMIGFLSRHSHVTSVFLPPHSAQNKKWPKKWKLSLPALTTVGGCPAYLRRFLCRFSSFPALRHIAFSLPPFKRNIEVINNVVGTIIEDYRPRILTLEFVFPSAFDELDMYASNPNREPHDFSFPAVEDIHFRSDGSFAFSGRTLPLLPPWLEMFPDLKRISFASNCLHCEPREWAEFLKAIEEACPHLDDVVMYDKEGAVLHVS